MIAEIIYSVFCSVSHMSGQQFPTLHVMLLHESANAEEERLHVRLGLNQEISTKDVQRTEEIRGLPLITYTHLGGGGLLSLLNMSIAYYIQKGGMFQEKP